MKVIWTPVASEELVEAVNFIAEDKPDAAVRVAERIYQHTLRLSEMPHIGRRGLIEGTRELVFAPWPYIVVYKALDDAVRIVQVRHASRD